MYKIFVKPKTESEKDNLVHTVDTGDEAIDWIVTNYPMSFEKSIWLSFLHSVELDDKTVIYFMRKKE